MRFSKILKCSTLISASSNEVPQGEIWVDKYIKDSYLKHEQTVHYEVAHQHQYQALLALGLKFQKFGSKLAVANFQRDLDS